MSNAPRRWTEEEFRDAVAVGERQNDRELHLVELLDEANPAYAECSSQEVARRRGWVLVQLGNGAQVVGALPIVLETLRTAHEPYLLAAAAHALIRAPRPDISFGMPLLRAVEALCSRDDLVDLDSWRGSSDDEDGFTGLIFALRALSWVAAECMLDVDRLHALGSSRSLPVEHRATVNRVMALQSLLPTGRANCCAPVRFTASREREHSTLRNVRFENQDCVEKTWAQQFSDRPTVVAFFYTRCDNPQKCSLTITNLGEIQRLLRAAGLGDSVQLAAISYDDQFDTPARMRTFASARGLRLDDNGCVLRIAAGANEVRDYFRSGVNFVGRIVNWHRIELFLLDSEGRCIGTYNGSDWKPQDVVDDLRRMPGSRRTKRGESPFEKLASLSPPLWALFLAMLPKCPICGASYLSAIGIAALPILDAWVALWPIMLAFLIVNVLLLVRVARSTRSVAPVIVAVAAAFVITVPGLAMGFEIALTIGFAMTLVSSTLSVILTSRPSLQRMAFTKTESWLSTRF